MNPLNGFSSTAVTNSDPAPPQHESDPTLSKQDPKSSLGSEADESDGSGPDYYTSDSEEDEDPYFEDQFSEKQKAKRVRLRAERDDIKPSYYYGEREAEEDALSKGASKPQLKRKGLRGVPVFEPRMDQFEDFYGYINKIDRWGMRSGIIKIIPPKEWSSQLPHLGQESLRTDGKGQMLKQARIKSPISQVIQGNRGLFRVMNVTKRKNYNALEWYDLANSVDHRPPDFFTPPEQSTSPGTQTGPDPSFRSTRSTRSSRRHTTQVTPILSKQAVSRKRKTPLPSNLDQTAGSPTASTTDLKSTLLTPNITPSISDSPVKPTVPNSDSVVGPTMSAINATPLSVNSVSHGQSDIYARLDSPSPLPNSNIHHTPPQATVNTVEGASKDHINPIEGTPKAELTCPDVANLNVNQADHPSGTAHTVLQVDSNMPDSIVSACPEMTESQAADQESTSAKKLKRVGPLPPSDEEWAQFVTCYDKLPYGAQKSDYTYKACRLIEQEYWRTIGNGGEPMYGADTTGSLFDERTKHWNVANLDNLLNRLKLKKKIPGVNTPYLYFGAWRATFAWHVEDADLYSINYIHFGAPKYWYSIPQEHNERFESFMASSFAKERFACPQFLRHKAFLASPAVLASCGIQLNRVVHLPGEIIITYPYGYHSGFNLGYNCAESVNFANEDWIEKGKKAKFCKCIPDAVTINVDAWLHEHEEALTKETEAERKNAEKAERAEQKRKRESDPKLPATKKPKPLADPDKVPKKKIKSNSATKPFGSQDNLHSKSSSNTANQVLPDPSKAPNTPLVKLPTKKIKAEGEISKAPLSKISKLKAPSKKVFPCALCPDLSEDNLVRILDEPQVSKSIMPAPGVDPTSQLDQPFSTTSTTVINTTATSPKGAALAQIPSAVAPSCANPDFNSLVIDPAIISSAVGASPHVPVASQSQTNESLPVKSNASAKPKPIRRAHKVSHLADYFS
ncbi:hypothetical protein CROQUDRAFT_587328 [Cronartium quercuum f. sp. fusiforme G11]|uniref:[Histone H3]-trimethyl-L-lysine(9) demethylase n=1 Tax=Cronartium quercuum f. sp. fusiforme G11 TaxID=708437 RepID=A0A9P6NFP9_9BASI|nr:hypothetical protein CROQUDRAFT_587328 [Cronartium quercuum f. sp. fusiforme G11]